MYGRKIETLTSRQNRDGKLLRVGCAEDKLDVPWRLLQRFQQCVESLGRQHVHFVDDVDLVTRSAWTHGCVGSQLSNFIDPAIAGTVDFQNVHVFAGIDGLRHIGIRIELAIRVCGCV